MNTSKETKVYSSTEKLSSDLEYCNRTDWGKAVTITGLQHYFKPGSESYRSLWHPAVYRGSRKMVLQINCGAARITGFTCSHLLKKSAFFYEYPEFCEAEIILLDLTSHVKFTVLLPEAAGRQTFINVTAILKKYIHRYLDENGLTRDRLKKMLHAYAALRKSEPESMALIQKAVSVYGSMALNDGFKTVKSGRDGILLAEPAMPEGLPADTEEEIKNSVQENGYILIPGGGPPYYIFLKPDDGCREDMEKEW